MTMNEFQAGKNLLSGHILLGRVNSPSHEIFSNERRVQPLVSPGRERKERIMPGEETLIRKVESIRLLADGSPFLMMD